MKSYKDLQMILNRIDKKGYKAYKDISGVYDFKGFKLHIDYVQGDPFASPSRIRVSVPQTQAAFPKEFYDVKHRKIAITDFLTRVFDNEIGRLYSNVGGTGKSGLLAIDKCGQKILERSSVYIDSKKVEARLEIGLPAAGRKVLAKKAWSMLHSYIPKIVESSLIYQNINQTDLWKQIQLADDQNALRQNLIKNDLVAFVANGSILPRQSGVSDRPLGAGAVPFQSPKSLEVAFKLPHRGVIKGMGISQGVTLIVGGGYHGKSTLLKALENGVYNHILGDGREYIVSRQNAVKVRAEDGRRVEKVDISPFINNLPNGQDTTEFQSENASGSTSQGTNIMEALEIGTDLLLIDEDTSATNFMVRDGRMQALVSQDKEPITPFIDQVKNLHNNLSVSTILVVGGCGDYFDVADTVIMLDEYTPLDVTETAKEIATAQLRQGLKKEDSLFTNGRTLRKISKMSFPTAKKGIKVKSKGLKSINYNKTFVDLTYLEQLVDSSQTIAIACIFEYIAKNIAPKELSLKQTIDNVYETIEHNGLDAISSYKGHPGNLAMPRKQELAAAINRFRLLKIM
ncbi:ABC-ATPase domain-containing protein [Proteinivorax hydrogeniformans]|uniref:ABC-ATPase domain-containing protein n=1 Tax=Proteinivorax hydrogeniformans TaxID=1826727 RepID=A0AAU8HRI9_9FIRM